MITVSAAQDTTDEHDETFTVTLSGVSSNAQLASDPTATGTITDDDDPPSLSVADVSTPEASLLAAFEVTLSAESGKTVTVSFTASAETGDTAESPADFSGFAALGLIFNPGDLTVNQAVVVVDDSIVEPDETFTVTLSNVMNAVISDATATGTITNDDTAAETCTLNMGDLWCGVVTVEAVQLSGATAGYGFGTSAGALSDTGFTVGSNDYTIDAVMTGVSPLAGQLLFGLFGGNLTNTDKAKLALYVDGHGDSFEFMDAGGPSPTGVYNWVSSGLDWMSAASVTLRLREVTRAAISNVAVTSTPLLTSSDGSTTHTYGVGETIEVSVTFNEAVDATSDTDFVLSVGGARRAALLSGSGTATLVFGYTVLAADVDANGIWIGDQDRTLAGDRMSNAQTGTITSVSAGVKVDLTHSALNTLGGHRVDGGRSIVLVEVTSTPMLETDTYGADETIRFTVTFNAAVDVTGDPVYTFSLANSGGSNYVNAAYESGTGTAELVFGYTVLPTDMDDNGIYQLGGEMDFSTVKGPVGLDSDDAIRFTVTSADAPLAYPVRAQRSGHKVDGSQTAGASSDATLSGLTVTAGGTDLVTFASGTTDYTPMVANDVAEVTVTAMTTDSGASIEYLDVSDMTLDDADTSDDGHQVTLAVGDTVIKVKVTAADGNATQTYMVTVTRAAAMTPTCTLNTGDIWCGTLTVAEFTQNTASGTSRGFYTGVSGNLVPDEFTDDGTSYSVYGIYYVTEAVTGSFAAGTLVLDGNPEIPTGLTFQLDGAEFSITSGTATNFNRYLWASSGLNWSVGDVVTARLNRATPIASTDATLTDLVVNDGTTNLTLTPTFASGMYTYTARVVNAVDEVTVTPTKNDSDASIEYLDGSDMTLDDAGTDAGHQVAVAVGDNVVKVKVTAEDGNATQTYMVTVTRAAAASTCTLNTGDLWCGAVTVSRFALGVLQVDGFGSGGGDLSDKDFMYGTNSYTIDLVATQHNEEILFFSLNSALTSGDRAGLAVHVDGSSDTFAFGAATYVVAGGSHQYTWTGTGLSWSGSPTTTVRLREVVTGPAAPTNFMVRPAGDAKVALSWDAPASDSGVTRHEYQFETDGSYGNWVQIANSAVGGANQASFTASGLTNEVPHTFQLRAVSGVGAGGEAMAGPVTPTPGICDRTQQVQDEILRQLSGVSDCAAVTVANLETVPRLDMEDKSITSLKAGDFAGLTAVTVIGLESNRVTSLPETVFSGLTALETLSLEDNFLSLLPAEVFSGLTALETLRLNDNVLSSLPAEVFSGLTALETLSLSSNDLSSLPGTVFSGLSSLTNLRLEAIGITELSAGLFSGLSKLESLLLGANQLTSLPDGLFSGLTGLTALSLSNNPDVLPLTVTLETAEDGQVRAKVLAGAPSDLVLPVIVENGTLAFGATGLRVAKGSVAGAPVSVIRTGETGDVTVDLGTPLPSLPPMHIGYEYAKAASGLPVEVPDALERESGVEGDLRLTDEESYTHPDGYEGVSGRAEIFHAERWGTVSSDGFSRSTTYRYIEDLDTNGDPLGTSTYGEVDNNAPALFCEAMGYTTGEYASGYGRPGVASQPSESRMTYYPVGSTYPPDGPEPIWVDDMTCAAGDADLAEDVALPAPMAHCGYAGWGLHNSNHGEDAGVRCWNQPESDAGRSYDPLTAAFEGLPEAHDGETAFSFRLAFSEAVAVTPEAMRTRALTVAGGAATGAARVDGGERRVGDHGHAGQPRGAINHAGPDGGLRGGRRGLHIGRQSPVERGGGHRVRPGGDKHGGDRDAGDQRDAAGRGEADRLDVGHLRRRRAGQRELRLPVDPHGHRHWRGDRLHLHAGGGRRGREAQGPGRLHRRRRPRGEPHQRGDRCRHCGAGAADGEL